jgi:KipI family sensor histidine kinase inhibitor
MTLYRICGDHALILEFGDEVDLSLNFKAILMKEMIKREKIIGISDIIVGTCALMIVYNPFEIRINQLIEHMKEIEKNGIDLNKEIPSRLIKIPVLFNDRWTRECSEAHQLPPDLESIAEYNGVSIEEFVSIYTSTDYWVKYVGFSPGLIAFNTLDSRKELRSPHLKIPRTWTPPGAVGIHRSGNCIYAVNSPGGVKMVGRTPLLIFDINQKNPAFKDGPALFRPGDRLRVIPLSGEREYLEIEKNVDNYPYEIEEGTYSGKLMKEATHV